MLALSASMRAISSFMDCFSVGDITPSAAQPSSLSRASSAAALAALAASMASAASSNALAKSASSSGAHAYAPPSSLKWYALPRPE